MSSPGCMDVPAAILLRNPGVTKEEFQELFNEVHISYRRSNDWHDTIYLDCDDDLFHHGLYSLAHWLKLDKEKDFDCYAENVISQKKRIELIKRGVGEKFLYPAVKITKGIITLEQLFEKEPHFNPEHTFDWSKKNGLFSMRFGRHSWGWYQRDGKYYLDELGPSQRYDFLNVPCAGNRDGLSESEMFTDDNIWSSVSVAAEGIEQKAWGLFGTNGFRHLDEFFRDFPVSKETLVRAHRAYWLSSYAKKHGLKNNELLRMSLDMGKPNIDWVLPLYESYAEDESYYHSTYDDPLPEIKGDKVVKTYPPQDFLDIHPRNRFGFGLMRKDSYPAKGDNSYSPIGYVNPFNYPANRPLLDGLSDYVDTFGEENLPEEWKDIGLLPF